MDSLTNCKPERKWQRARIIAGPEKGVELWADPSRVMRAFHHAYCDFHARKCDGKHDMIYTDWNGGLYVLLEILEFLPVFATTRNGILTILSRDIQ